MMDSRVEIRLFPGEPSRARLDPCLEPQLKPGRRSGAIAEHRGQTVPGARRRSQMRIQPGPGLGTPPVISNRLAWAVAIFGSRRSGTFRRQGLRHDALTDLSQRNLDFFIDHLKP